MANSILDALKASSTNTLSSSQISLALGNNKTPEVIGRALALLLADKLAEPVDPSKPKKEWRLQGLKKVLKELKNTNLV